MTNLPVLHHQDREHARLSASSAYRWIECPGSVWLEDEIPDRDEKTQPYYTREGTAAHEVSERCLVSGLDPETFIGQKFEGVEVDSEMADYLHVYVDKIRQLGHDADASLMIEQRVSLEALNPPEPMYGTTDIAIPDRKKSHLIVADLKYGRGVVVEPKDNPQGLYYALGTVLALDEKFDTITIFIIQPRAPHPDGPIRSWTLTWDELLVFKDKVMAAAEVVQTSRALKVGPWCRFCKASSTCTAQRDHAVLTVQNEFSAIPVTREADASPLPLPETLSQEELLEVHSKMKIVESWFKSIAAELHSRQMDGVVLPGLKLVQTLTNRQWQSEQEVKVWLRNTAPDLDPDQYEPRKMISPAQVEKLLKPYKIRVPKHLAERKPTGYATALDSDNRPAVTPGNKLDAFVEGA